MKKMSILKEISWKQEKCSSGLTGDLIIHPTQTIKGCCAWKKERLIVWHLQSKMMLQQMREQTNDWLLACLILKMDVLIFD